MMILCVSDNGINTKGRYKMAGDKKSVGTTRREFLAGTGAALAFGVASRFAGHANAIPIVDVENHVIGRIEHDASLCAGCGVCTLMCSLYNEGESIVSLSRAELVRDPIESSYSMNVCRQCLAPSCYEACPQKDLALCIDKTTGVKYVNPEECIGCGKCTSACPQKTAGIKLNPDKEVAFKCDLCRGRDNGPICVEYCGQKALSIVWDNRED
jgi:Fe-S-cluster-containing hydrogenase component 2